MGASDEFFSALDDYHAHDAKASAEERIRTHSRLVNRYYDAVTSFYEFGWGTSFHFSPRRPREGLAAAQRRHQEGVASLLRLRPGMRVADVGCGIGGPLAGIGKASGANITGLNNNAHQIARGETVLRKAGLAGQCGFLLADYTDVPLPDGHFDAAYSFEAFCHAPDIAMPFREIARLLRPGGELALVDWCWTECFDEDDRRHRDLRARIERVNATPNLLTTRQQVAAAEAAGFEVLASADQAATSHPRTPWYVSLQGRDLSLSSLARIPAGRAFTAAATGILERLKMAPTGTRKTAAFLNGAADALVEGGELGIFTPSFLIHARKP